MLHRLRLRGLLRPLARSGATVAVAAAAVGALLAATAPPGPPPAATRPVVSTHIPVYREVASDGGIFTFGGSSYLGSMGGKPLNQPVVGMAATPDGGGYWEVASDGGIFTFGDARFYGSAASQNLGTWVTGMAVAPHDAGYWLVAATAAVLPFGDAVSYGPLPNDPPFSPTTAIAATPDGQGYWLLQPDDGPIDFRSPPGSTVTAQGAQIVSAAAARIGLDPADAQGQFCNPYGPCEPWCALFATWAWQQAGVPVPSDGFVGDVYGWAAANTQVLSPAAAVTPGDAIFYGTGTANVAEAPHMGIVAQRWPDGAITTVEGDAGPEPNGEYGVITNGPFFPLQSMDSAAVDLPTYGFAVP